MTVHTPRLAWARGGWRDLYTLTKPRVTALVVFTAVATAIAASGPWISFTRLLALAVAGGLTAGGAAAMNHYFEGDVDARMRRTAGRPVPSGRLGTPELALFWGTLLVTAGLVYAFLALPTTSAVFVLMGFIVYVPIYTLLLKRRTVLNVVIGGAAGSFAVLAGWAMVRADWPVLPFALAAVVFFWTPAHFWALALRHQSQYEEAGVPMLPVQIGMERTVPWIVLHAVLAIMASLLVLRGAPLAIAAVSGLVLVHVCLRLWRKPSPERSMQVFKVSNLYLLVVFTSLLLL